MKKYLVILALISTALAGCTRTEKHIATGAVVGAVAGHAIAGDRGSSYRSRSWCWNRCFNCR